MTVTLCRQQEGGALYALPRSVDFFIEHRNCYFCIHTHTYTHMCVVCKYCHFRCSVNTWEIPLHISILDLPTHECHGSDHVNWNSKYLTKWWTKNVQYSDGISNNHSGVMIGFMVNLKILWKFIGRHIFTYVYIV